MIRFILNFLAQVADVDVYCAGIAEKFCFPNALQQHFTREHAAGFFHQLIEQIKFPQGKGDWRSTFGELMAGKINGENAPRHAFFRTAQGFHAP